MDVDIEKAKGGQYSSLLEQQGLVRVSRALRKQESSIIHSFL